MFEKLAGVTDWNEAPKALFCFVSAIVFPPSSSWFVCSSALLVCQLVDWLVDMYVFILSLLGWLNLYFCFCPFL